MTSSTRDDKIFGFHVENDLYADRIRPVAVFLVRYICNKDHCGQMNFLDETGIPAVLLLVPTRTWTTSASIGEKCFA